jgi:hypothetical protein
MKRRHFFFAALVVFAGDGECCVAQIAASSTERVPVVDGQDSRDDRRAEVQRVAESMTFFREKSGEREEVPIVADPVLRYTDAPRSDRDGGVWVIGDEGKPLGMMVVYTKTGFDKGHWIQAVTSLCPNNSLKGVSHDRANWNPLQAGVSMQAFPQAPEPSTEPAARLRQMKALARRFTGHEFWPADSRHELRLLVQPLYRYQEPDVGILEGAIFALAHDTNPEVFVIIEAVQRDGATEWQYGVGRFGFAELHVALDGEEVWTRDIISSTTSTEPYWLFHLQM